MSPLGFEIFQDEFGEVESLLVVGEWLEGCGLERLVVGWSSWLVCLVGLVGCLVGLVGWLVGVLVFWVALVRVPVFLVGLGFGLAGGGC